MPTRWTEISILKTRYVFGQSWFVGSAPHYDACKVNRCICDMGSTLWKEVLVLRALFTSRNLSAVPFPHNIYSSYAWSWEAGSARPFLFTRGAHWCTDDFTEQLWILSMHSLRLVACTYTALPVILDYLLETKAVWLPFYFLIFTW